MLWPPLILALFLCLLPFNTCGTKKTKITPIMPHHTPCPHSPYTPSNHPRTPHKSLPRYTIRTLTPITPIKYKSPNHQPSPTDAGPTEQGCYLNSSSFTKLNADTSFAQSPGTMPPPHSLHGTPNHLPSFSQPPPNHQPSPTGAGQSQPTEQGCYLNSSSFTKLNADTSFVQSPGTVPPPHSLHDTPSHPPSFSQPLSPKAAPWYPQGQTCPPDALPVPPLSPSGVSFTQYPPGSPPGPSCTPPPHQPPRHIQHPPGPSSTPPQHQPTHHIQHLSYLISSLLYTFYSSFSFSQPVYSHVMYPPGNAWDQGWTQDSYQPPYSGNAWDQGWTQDNHHPQYAY